MKKLIIFIFVIVLLSLFCKSNKKIIIPENSIRFRIIANSNSNEDQKIKWDVNKEIIPILSNITKNSNSIDETRNRIKESIPIMSSNIKKYTNDFDISFKNNYFPLKEYQNVKYNEGYYESLVITIGNGLGDNWWCVLYPPLCLIESNEDKISSNTYELYIKKIINKYL